MNVQTGTSAKGLFRTTASGGRAFAASHRKRAAQKAAHAARLDTFAELLSLDLAMPAIAERMGISQPYARTLLQRLTKRMGVQAC